MQNISLSEFYIIGISRRTNNQKASEDLQQLWEKFIGENIMNKIPDKISSDIYAIYTDYASDHTGDYTTILGCRVNSLEVIPDDMIGRTIPSDNYQLFTAKGMIPASVVKTWEIIWSEPNINRSYSFDFEVYSEKTQHPESPEVDIYIAVK
jgi:predicted transcriptional regulator YdeE